MAHGIAPILMFQGVAETAMNRYVSLFAGSEIVKTERYGPGEAELDAAFEQLSTGGQVLMPLGNYGFSTKFGWVTDSFGVSWQLNLE